MFPDYEDELNEGLKDETGKERLTHGRDLSFDFNTGEIALTDGAINTVTGRDAMLQWIAKILLTERGSNEIHAEYGVQTKRIMFSDYPKNLKRAEIQDDISEKLMEHEAIHAVSEFEYKRKGINEVASFFIKSEYGTIEEEVVVSGQE